MPHDETPTDSRSAAELRAWVAGRLALREADVQRLLGWLDTVQGDVDAMLRSWTWRAGSLAARAAGAALGRRPGPGMPEHLAELFAELERWRVDRASERRDGDERIAAASLPELQACRRRAPRIDLVVWAGDQDASACLEALAACTHAPHRLTVAGRHPAPGVAHVDAAELAHALEQAWRDTDADYLAWVTSTARVTPLWLLRAVACLESAPWLGLVAPATDARDLLGSPAAGATGTGSESLGAAGLSALVAALGGRGRPVPALRSACVVLRRHAWRATGGLLAELGPEAGTWDLCLRAQAWGHPSALLGSVYVEAPPALAAPAVDAFAARHGPSRLRRVLAATNAPAPALAEIREHVASWLSGRPAQVETAAALRVTRFTASGQDEANGDVGWLRSLGVDAQLVAGASPLEAWDAAAAAHVVIGAREPIPTLARAAFVAAEDDPCSPRARLERLGEWHAASAQAQPSTGTPHVAVLLARAQGGEPIASAHIRLLQPLGHPSLAGQVTLQVLTLAELPAGLDADVLVVQRTAVPDPARAEQLLTACRGRGCRLVVDLDDDLLSAASKPDLDRPLPASELEALRMLLLEADRVVVSTPALAARLRPLSARVVVLANALDERLWLAKARPPSTPGPVRVLCMGTRTHARDLDPVRPACARLERELAGQVVFETVGVVPGTERALGTRLEPASARDDYLRFVGWLTRRTPGWDIGLAPLAPTEFNRCKSAIKYLDYAALGAVPVCSDLEPYHLVRPDVDGVLVRHDEDAWYQALKRLVLDPERRARLAAGAAARLRDEALLTDRAGDALRAYAGAEVPQSSS